MMFINKRLASLIAKGKPFYKKAKFPKIFNWDDLEHLLNLRPFVDSRRFTIINDLQYTWERQEWMSDVNTFPPKLLKEELKKYHCYFNDASRVNESVNTVCAELDVILNGATDAHIYFSVADDLNTGFGIHCDYSHNFIVQMEGETNFLVWDKVADENTSPRNLDCIDEDPCLNVVMKPGDVIFVPLKYYHRAINKTKRLSISFPTAVNIQSIPQDRTWIKL